MPAHIYTMSQWEGSDHPVGHYLKVCRLLVQSGVYLEAANLPDGRQLHWTIYILPQRKESQLIVAGMCVCVCMCVEQVTHLKELVFTLFPSTDSGA